jgi:hypothetical protein
MFTPTTCITAIARLGLFALLATPLFAQEPLTITPSFDGEIWIPRNTQIELKVSPDALPAGGRIAVLIGITDLSAAFAQTPEGLRYTPGLLLLPAGESVVVVSLVKSKDDWTEVARFPIRVLTTGGFEKAELKPRADLNLHGRLAEGHNAAATPPSRSVFQDLTVSAGLESTNSKGVSGLRTQSNFVGVTHDPEALRFGLPGNRAPNVDMADYLIQIDRGRSNLSVGSVMFGRNRLLLNDFASRGLTSRIHFGHVSLALAAANATTLVGWNNPFGVRNADHRVASAELGFEAIPDRPGGFGVQLALLDGSRLPQSGYNQGSVNSAEQSRGVGLHVLASDAAQRLQIDTGVSRSRFNTPADPSQSIAASSATRNARYADVAFDVLRTLHVGQSRPATLVATYRHEQADPLYQSVGSATKADFLQNSIAVAGSLGALTIQVNHGRSHDNVAGVTSLLKTLTRTNGTTIAAPLAPLFSVPASPWLPALTYSVIQTHVLSDELPLGGLFTINDLPNLMSVNQNLGAQWTGTRWRVSYGLVHTSQDNRQVGLEPADFRNLNHAVQFGVDPTASVTTSLEVAFEKATNLQLSQDMHTRRVGGSVNVLLTKTSTLAAGVSDTRTTDSPLTNDQSNAEWRLEFTQRINRRTPPADRPLAQMFFRYTRKTGDLIVPGSLPVAPREWTLNTGITFYVF